VSISLGSSKRDKKVTATLFGEDFEIERVGTDGDKEKYRQMVRDLDGKVDAFGVGGTDIYLYAGNKRYTWREPLSLMEGAKKTPFVDGSGLKHTLERETIVYLQQHGIVDFSGLSALLVSAVDRFGMAEALATHCKSVVYGDLLFGVGVPMPIRSWAGLKRFAYVLLPIICRLPFQWFYPTGEKQDKNTPKFTQFFDQADVIAGDYLLIKKYMPKQMPGKTILTNTTTEQDVADLRSRGVARLITTTPVFDGRSFGTNVMEGVLVTLLGKTPDQLTAQDYLSKLKELGWTPRIQELNESKATEAAATTDNPPSHA
jgi:hypothetical protein